MESMTTTKTKIVKTTRRTKNTNFWTAPAQSVTQAPTTRQSELGQTARIIGEGKGYGMRAAAEGPGQSSREKLGEALRVRRLQLGWTTAELAKRSSLGESTIRQIENVTGKSSRRLATMEVLSRALGLTPARLANVLNCTQQDDIPVQVVDTKILLSGVNELRQRLVEIDAAAKERQDRAEAVSLERHQSLERCLDNIGAMLKHLAHDLAYDLVPDVAPCPVTISSHFLD